MTRMMSAAALLLGVLCFVGAGTIRLAAETNTRVMTGLNSPRGLALGPDGSLYVAEAGRGGAGPCLINSVNETRCFGMTGAISRLSRGVQTRLISNLPSHALPNGDSATGPNDVSFPGTAGMFVMVGLGFDPAVRPSFGPGGLMFGKLLQILATGEIREAADVSAYEGEVNPARGPVDTNPYGLLVLPTMRLVADAGANALLSVVPSGLVNTVAVLPSRPGRATDSVPTSVVVGPDGAYYVGELSGVPFAAGAANVYRVMPGQTTRVFRSGFTTVTDIDFGPDGSLYVLEHSTGPAFFGRPGDIVRVAPDGTRTVIVSNLNRPTSLLVDRDGSIYYTNMGITAGAGEVWKFTP
jgi:hypothetical protein